MLNLNGIVSIEVIREIEEYTELRLRDRRVYETPEALALYEQRILPKDKIFELCQAVSSKPLSIPPTSYVPDNLVLHFMGSDVVPVSYSPMRSMITCIALPEIGTNHLPIQGYSVEIVYTTIYNYFHEYIRQFGHHRDLMDISAKLLLDSIVNEAITLGAADITISSVNKTADVYYDVRKNKVYSQRILTVDNIKDIIKLLCFESPMDNLSNAPKYVGVNLNDYYRGRVVINPKYHGSVITIRLLPNASFEKTLEDCNLSKEAIEFFRKYYMNRESGLRLIVGSTMSGKNTTSLACLREITMDDKRKIVSIEMPVEQELPKVEQINCEDEEEYDLAINSLLRQNPGLVYITEMGDTTATSVMRVTNTGKIVMSTAHCNSVSDVVGRLQDMTGLSTDRIIQTLHSIVYQELVRDDVNDTIAPKVRYVYLSKERKNLLYNRPYGEIITKLQQWEGGDVW